MKRLLLVLIFSLQTVIFSHALAWSPLDVIGPVTETRHYCYATTAGSEEKQEDHNNQKEEAEDEEPDCD